MAARKQNNPSSVPMVFFRTGWMSHYRGLNRGDQIEGGGAFVREHGYGHEIFNFQPFRGKFLGYVQPSRGKGGKGAPTIHIERLGVPKSTTFISGVTVIWVAPAPGGGNVVVGWYKNATVYRHWQPAPTNARREHLGERCGFYATALRKDSTLLKKDERLFPIPKGRNGMGQANVWYADDPMTHRKLRRDILRYLETRQLSLSPGVRSGGRYRQPDPLLRQRVEQAAVEMTANHYRRFGYTVDFVEKDNCGWDLTAIHKGRELRLEVKGLVGDRIQVELTPNEYTMMRKYRDSYRVCIVSSALTAPRLQVFGFSPESDRWEDQDSTDHHLEIDEKVGARCWTRQ